MCLVLLVLAVSGCAKLIISQSLKALNSTTDYYAIESPHNGETHCSINMMVDGEEYSFKSLWNIQKLPNIIIPSMLNSK